MSDTTVISVSTEQTGADGNYDILIGHGLLANIGEQIGTKATKVLIVHAPTLGAKAAALRESLVDRYEVLLAEIAEEERVREVAGGEYAVFKYPNPDGDDLVDSERVPLLQRLDDQIPRVE